MSKKIYIILAILALFGLLTLLSLSLEWGSYKFLIRQSVFYLIGFVLMILVAKLTNVGFLKTNKFFIFFLYVLVLILLAGVLIQPHRVQNVKSWFVFLGFSFQPSELAKLVLVLLLAKYFSKRHIEIWRWRHILISGFYFLLIFLLVVAEPDLGNALIIAFLWGSIILVAGVRFRQLLILSLVGFLVGFFAWHNLLKPYQKERIVSFLHPQEDILGVRYQANEAKIAIGEGGLFGVGLGGAIQTKYKFLPQAHSDFIFSAFVEHWGVFGAFLLFLVYLALFFELYKKFKSFTKPESNFEKIFIFGYMAFLFIQILIHIGGNLDLLPITGITLPFLSYGGSNLLINFLFLGIIEAM